MQFKLVSVCQRYKNAVLKRAAAMPLFVQKKINTLCHIVGKSVYLFLKKFIIKSTVSQGNSHHPGKQDNLLIEQIYAMTLSCKNKNNSKNTSTDITCTPNKTNTFECQRADFSIYFA